MSQRIATFDRRQFLVHAAAGVAAATVSADVRAAAGEPLRVGLIGCGGRGTGAIAQALAADPSARLVAMGDLFADQIDSSRRLLERACPDHFARSAPHAFVGADAWRNVLGSELDLVVLAAPPAWLPTHLLAAVRAGLHVYCEAPVAVDLPGVRTALEAVGIAEAVGLSVGSGLCFRHDAATQARVAAMHAGQIGVVEHVRMEARINLPWFRPPADQESPALHRQRNWVSSAALSGGPFVEHHVHAIDKALWAMGDVAPAWVEARFITESAMGNGGDPAAGVAARYGFADGRTIDAICARRADQPDRIVELATGGRGTLDLSDQATTRSGGRFAAAMTHLVHALHGGRRVDDGRQLCAATMAAVLGRRAAETGSRLAWPMAAAAPATSPVQSARA